MNGRFLLFFICLTLCFKPAKAQDYSVLYTHPNASGQPGDLFLAQIKVQNGSNEDIIMHFERIVNNLPGTWTSCFCYPHCIAPWIDTMTFAIGGFSADSIMPNFGTDSVPSTATVKIILYQVGYESSADTITFTGTTMPAGFASPELPGISVYPNPFADFITVKSAAPNSILTISNGAGQMIRVCELSATETRIDLSFLDYGLYYIEIQSPRGQKCGGEILRVQ